MSKATHTHQARKPAFRPATIGAVLLSTGQRFRVDEAPTATAITMRFLAQRQQDRQLRRDAYRGAR